MHFRLSFSTVGWRSKRHVIINIEPGCVCTRHASERRDKVHALARDTLTHARLRLIIVINYHARGTRAAGALDVSVYARPQRGGPPSGSQWSMGWRVGANHRNM